MKKKWIMLSAAILAAGMLSGCGAEETTVLKDMKVDKYVTLGEYKGLQVSAEPMVTVTEEDVESTLLQVYISNVTADNGGVMDRAVAEGDTVNIDYVGKKDGVAFDGGSNQGDSLTIGSGRFIPGFEEGLVGVMPGETVDLDITFPEDYSNAELAGKPVVFTVTVNFIQPSQMEDTVVAGFGDENFKTVEDMRSYVRDYMNEKAQENYETGVQNTVLAVFMQNCEFKEMPESMVANYEENIRASIEAMAMSNGVDADTYTQYFYGADFETFATGYAEESARQSMALQSVANKENLNVSDEELQEKLLEYAKNAGYETVEEYVGENSMEEYREFFMLEKVTRYLTENAVITNP